MTQAEREKLLDAIAADKSGKLRQRLQDEALLLEVESLELEVLSKKEQWSNDDMPLALGISRSAWQQMKKSGMGPPCERYAGRPFWEKETVRKWKESLQPEVLGGGTAAVGHDDNEDDDHATPPTPPPLDTRFLHAAPQR